MLSGILNILRRFGVACCLHLKCLVHVDASVIGKRIRVDPEPMQFLCCLH
jgi:hypothetical protein